MLELRRVHRYWGPRRIRHELVRRQAWCLAGVLPSESAVYRCLVRAGLVEPWRGGGGRSGSSGGNAARRWSCGRWMWSAGSCWLTASHAKALTGVDDHSRFCVSARLMPRERTRPVCDGLAAALRAYGCPQQMLTDNGQGVHRPVQPSAGRGALRPDLPGERHRASAHRAAVTRRRPARSSGSTARCARSSTPAGCSARCGPRSRRWTSGSSQYNTERPHQSLDGADAGRAVPRATATSQPDLSPASGPKLVERRPTRR